MWKARPIPYLVLVLLGAFMATGAEAQLQQDPTHGCEDPSCSSGECFRCYPEPARIDSQGNVIWRYKCVAVEPSPLFNSSKECTAGSSGCAQRNWCVLA